MRKKSTVLTIADKEADLARRIKAVEALGEFHCPTCLAPYKGGRYSRPYFICGQCGHRWSTNPLIQSLSDFLEQLHSRYPWDWFGTFTFAESHISPAGASYWFRRYLERVAEVGLANPMPFGQMNTVHLTADSTCMHWSET